jgi:hypothetical protein
LQLLNKAEGKHMKKTTEVATLKETVNRMLSQGVMGVDYRMGAIAVLESALFETLNYNGFRYLREEEVPVLQKPGQRRSDNGIGASFEDTDDSRRCYY